jgi:hypothetical protein
MSIQNCRPTLLEAMVLGFRYISALWANTTFQGKIKLHLFSGFHPEYFSGEKKICCLYLQVKNSKFGQNSLPKRQ